MREHRDFRDLAVSSCWYNGAMQGVNGVHHITAIAGPAQENLDFYAGVLGMRLVKRSVNQDDPTHLPSVLRGRRRPSRIRPDLLSVGADGAAAAGIRSRDGGRARGAAGESRLLGTASAALRHAAGIGADALRPAGAGALRSARPPRRARRSAGRTAVHALGRQPGAGRAADPRPARRPDLGARRDRDQALPDHRPRLRGARHRERLDPLRFPRLRRRRRRSRRAGSAARRVGRGQRPSSRLARRRRSAPGADARARRVGRRAGRPR